MVLLLKQKEEIMPEYHVNDYISNYQLKDYGKNGTPSGALLDCSLGVNPEPVPDAVFKELGKINKDIIKHYPHDESVLEEIAHYYRNKCETLSWLTKDNMYLGDGTTDILHNLNVLCLNRGAKVLGHAPQFTAYVDQVNCLGAVYDSCKMIKDNNYLFVAESYMAQMTSNHSLFIVENPNNPTGQILKISDIEDIAARARSLGKILIVDEAYGDYMPLENSAINLIRNYPNVVITRTFSKGFGMAGIRLGYLIASNEYVTSTLRQFKKVENQFNCNGIARSLGIAFLRSGAKIPDLISVEKNKAKILKTVGKMAVAATAPTTPLMTLYYNTSQPDFNLQTFLFDEVKLLTVSCSTYDQLDKRAVRLMLPNTENIDLLAQMIRTAESMLPPL
jgi:histidinol-phosphate aminotransferase